MRMAKKPSTALSQLAEVGVSPGTLLADSHDPRATRNPNSEKSLFSFASKGGASFLDEGDHLGLCCHCRFGLSRERWQMQRLGALG
jgi:hypothetical protein